MGEAQALLNLLPWPHGVFAGNGWGHFSPVPRLSECWRWKASPKPGGQGPWTSSQPTLVRFLLRPLAECGCLSV